MNTKLPRILLTAASSAILGAGCVAIPMGRETFTTEYPTDIRATWDSPVKTYAPSVSVSEGDKDRHTASIALHAGITSEQPQEQQHKTVTVEKQKRLAVGLFPMSARDTFRPKGSLTPVSSAMFYNGDGKYSTRGYGNANGEGAMGGGGLLTYLTLGLVSTPISMVSEIFGPYEKDLHHLGSAEAGKSTQAYGRTITSTTSYSSTDLDLLRKFPMADREKIGAWTFHEDDAHPHNTFWHGFEAQWIGVYKYCTYVVKDGGISKRTPVAPKVETSRRTVRGPYTATLSLPSLDYRETVAVEPGKTNAVFRLLDAANGDATAKGTIHYAFPVEGEKSVVNADDREILKLAAKREWPVTVALPAPRAERVADVSPVPAVAKSPAHYKVKSIERPESGGLIVRVSVDDTAKTFEVDREVQPEIRRMFREQFATGDNANRREKLGMELADGGRTLVYTVVFE